MPNSKQILFIFWSLDLNSHKNLTNYLLERKGGRRSLNAQERFLNTLLFWRLSFSLRLFYLLFQTSLELPLKSIISTTTFQGNLDFSIMNIIILPPLSPNSKVIYIHIFLVSVTVAPYCPISTSILISKGCHNKVQ